LFWPGVRGLRAWIRGEENAEGHLDSEGGGW